MSEETERLYSEAEKRLKQEHDKAVEKIKEELKGAERKALSK
ncbi:MAG: hypothetical protein ACE5KA_02010 [Nitrososphaerales archaeon]